MSSSSRVPKLLLVLLALLTAPACRAIEGIFKAGVGVGFFMSRRGAAVPSTLH